MKLYTILLVYIWDIKEDIQKVQSCHWYYGPSLELSKNDRVKKGIKLQAVRKTDIFQEIGMPFVWIACWYVHANKVLYRLWKHGVFSLMKRRILTGRTKIIVYWFLWILLYALKCTHQNVKVWGWRFHIPKSYCTLKPLPLSQIHWQWYTLCMGLKPYLQFLMWIEGHTYIIFIVISNLLLVMAKF